MAPITADRAASRRLYVDVVALPLERSRPHPQREDPPAAGIRRLAALQAAETCFGTSERPTDRPVPQASIEFHVADADAVRVAETELRGAGNELLYPTERLILEPTARPALARHECIDGA